MKPNLGYLYNLTSQTADEAKSRFDRKIRDKVGLLIRCSQVSSLDITYDCSELAVMSHDSCELKMHFLIVSYFVTERNCDKNSITSFAAAATGIDTAFSSPR